MKLVQAWKCVWTLSCGEPFFFMRTFLLPYDTITIVAPMSGLQYCSFACDRC